ncbi:hypothetical protein [Chamaesiphon sp. VAR_48_metabat_403]|uniref:hypothetical protein n=1 Tax=Chamaesiphon sp. VAR_48_metabat_403 TaxID=2964700 RepID=UPI00286E7E5F|nr:hypothetical protein [Chamaesiphon sp. VAR_48_metabat_403]
MLRANLKWKLVSQLLVGSFLVLMLTVGIASCGVPSTTEKIEIEPADTFTSVANNDGPLAEVNTPVSISQLAPSLDKYQPQVKIINPKPDEILTDDLVTVKLKVSDLPLFKQPELGLGNHLHVILDKQTYQGVYDLSQPLVFKNLAAGTHTLRVFASRPWHESFKNQGAFDLVTFHVLTKTAENHPDLQKPLLTYSRPAGTYGAEPMMLDYYLTNIPDRPIAPGGVESLPNWRVRVTVNDQQFSLDRWAPIYLQGFKKGKNWVRLELVDDRGNPIPNVYNDTLSIFTYDPQNKDALAKLIGGELSPNLARTLVDPEYIAIQPSPLPTPTPSIAPLPIIQPTTTPIVSLPSPETKPNAHVGGNPAQIVVPSPSPIAPPARVKPSPSPIVIPEPIAKTLPTPNPDREPASIVKIAPQPVAEPTPTPKDRVPNPAQLPIVTIPSIAPTPTPIVIVPVPSIVATAPTPVAKPDPIPPAIPDLAKNSPPAHPEPIAIVIPAPTNAPTSNREPSKIEIVTPPVNLADKSIAQSPPVKPVNPTPAASPAIPAPPTQIAQNPPNSTPSNLPVVETIEKTWQARTIELFDVAKAKIRAFTNTIPAKAQRFGRNVQIWSAQAMELIERLRDRG